MSFWIAHFTENALAGVLPFDRIGFKKKKKKKKIKN